jgi:hypothetical protein
MIRFANRIIYGRSAPPGDKGLHLIMRHKPYTMPFDMPCFLNTIIAYSEQQGMYLQCGYCLEGANICWYRRISMIKPVCK